MSNQSISKWAGLRDLATAIRELLIIRAIGIFFLMPETFKSFLYNSDIQQLVRTIDSARGKSRDINNRLKRAEKNLTSPDELFKRSSASDF